MGDIDCGFWGGMTDLLSRVMHGCSIEKRGGVLYSVSAVENRTRNKGYYVRKQSHGSPDKRKTGVGSYFCRRESDIGRSRGIVVSM